jgi:hypothetical protein
MSPFSLVTLYVLFRLKHFICDFLLQTDWMALMKGKPGGEGYRALFTHSAIHAVGTLAIVVLFAPALCWLGLVDFVIHSVIDRVKGIFTYKKGWTPRETVFWWTLGADQEAHNFTHLAYIIIIYIYLGGMVN